MIFYCIMYNCSAIINYFAAITWLHANIDKYKFGLNIKKYYPFDNIHQAANDNQTVTVL